MASLPCDRFAFNTATLPRVLVATSICIGDCGGTGSVKTPLITAGAALLGVALTYVLGLRRERARARREQRAAAWLLHEELWEAQSAIARALHGVNLTRPFRRRMPGAWWTLSEQPLVDLGDEQLGLVALALSGKKKHHSHWRWVSNARARVQQHNIEAGHARVVKASEYEGDPDLARSMLRGKDAERLATTYLRLDVARRALVPAGISWREHDYGWRVARDAEHMTKDAFAASGLTGPYEAVNADHRLRQLHLVPLESPDEPASPWPSGVALPASPDNWRETVLKLDPTMTRLHHAYPWVLATESPAAV